MEGSIEDGPGHGGRVDQAMVGRGNQRDGLSLMLLALKMEGGGHEPRKVGSP